MNQQHIGRADEHPNQNVPRKVYEKPRLEVYGDLTEISKSIVGNMLNDGSAHSNKHFTS
jgi:hypothetical protein